ncbi:MAG TPA: amidohydrolase family protein [Bacteroidia bacterium]|jgi:imidazolonepropionase-like amidohydrolase|nr:amidohydrolase family protein [Bacteroidia bacterium]
MKKYLIIASAIFSTLTTIAQQPIPASPEKKSILLYGGTVHTATGKIIENGFVGIKDGKINLVSATFSQDSSEYDTVINCTGKQIYPGFIDPNCSLGLVESGAVRATTDIADIGALNPELRTLTTYNTDSKITPVVRINGVLTAQIAPQGGLISGTSSIMSLDGWNWEDACYKADDGVHVNWPAMYTRIQLNPDQIGGFAANKNYDKQVQVLQKFLSDAQAYSKQKTHVETNIKMEAMKGVFDGSKTLYIHADFAKEILASITTAKGLSIPKIVLVDGRDSWMVTTFLKQNNIPVILTRIHSQPAMPDDDIDQPYKTPYILQKAGILFCLENEGDQEENASRNLPFMAGTAITFGLTPEEGLDAITSNTAKILGIESTTGSIEVGKDATLIVSDGDALDMRTNNITLAFIKGRKIQLTSIQTALYHEYMQKYGLK